MLADELRPIFLFDGLTDAQVADLATASEKVAFDANEELFKEGDPAAFWWVLLDGKIQIVRRAGRAEPVVMTVMENPGQWAGGFQAWADASYLATGRGEVAGHVLKVPATELARLAGEWTPFGVHMIRGFFQTVRSMDTLSRQREELIKLGEMSARLAHEINNPASAAARSVDSLSATCDAMLSSLVRLSELSLSSERFVAIDALRREVDGAAAVRDPIAVADAEEALSDWLEAHGVGAAWKIAPALAVAGVDTAWCERAAQILDGALEPGLEWVATTLREPSAAHRDEELDEPRVRAHRRSQVVLADGPTVDADGGRDRGHREHTRDVASQARPRLGRAELRRRRSPSLREPRRPESGLDHPHRQRDRCHGRHRHPHTDHPCRTRRPRGRGGRHGPGHAALRAEPRLRAVVHDEGRRARARGSASTSRTRSCTTCTTARSRSTPHRGER